MSAPFIDPAIFGDLRASVCSIWGEGAASVDFRGGRVPDAAGPILQNRPCQLVPVDRANESESEVETLNVALFDVLLDAVYPQISENHSAEVDGQKYDILRVSTDPMKTISILRVRKTK